MKYAVILFTLLTASVIAEPLNVDYGAFYSHLRKIDDKKLDKLEFAFGFKLVGETRLCQINSGLIHTQKVDLPIHIRDDNRFVLPTEKALKLADAQVQLDLVEPANQCDMSVQIQVKPELIQSNLSITALSAIMEQFDQFFDDMGSFLSFLMPSPEGILLQFKSDQVPQISVNNKLSTDLTVNQHQLILTRNWLSTHQGEMRFVPAPNKISVYVNQD
ncbi:DUF2987 domain-containing protein [Neptunicella sp.]|uniref:DUF2987 domain-containing protein n=1 Tax=Neptunicella sp. TaxID=2125986 RepID=UPI003F68C36A